MYKYANNMVLFKNYEHYHENTSIGQNDARYSLVIILHTYEWTMSKNIYEPRSDKRDLLAIKVKSDIFTEKERSYCCEQLQKI